MLEGQKLPCLISLMTTLVQRSTGFINLQLQSTGIQALPPIRPPAFPPEIPGASSIPAFSSMHPTLNELLQKHDTCSHGLYILPRDNTK